MRKSLALFMLLSSLLSAKSGLSVQECLKIKYAHTLGGTMHSKHKQRQNLLKKIEKTLPFTKEQALKKIQKEHPRLHVLALKLHIQNCKVRYIATTNASVLFFDAHTLQQITKVDPQ